ncbi:MAG: hypothetical protein OXH76_01430 [Boseongicola sp.]|nr:hypothetical protein [Boseongicola sp.]
MIETRFSNPAIQDATHRVAFDGPTRHTGLVLPILRDALAAGGSVADLSLVEALWVHVCRHSRRRNRHQAERPGPERPDVCGSGGATSSRRMVGAA